MGYFLLFTTKIKSFTTNFTTKKHRKQENSGNLRETQMLHSTLLTVCNCLITGQYETGRNSSVAEGESATYADIIEEFYNSTIFTTKITTK